VTQILVLHTEQFAKYDYSALAVARTAMTLGHLRLVVSPKSPLPCISLPVRPIVEPRDGARATSVVRSRTDTRRLCGDALARLRDRESVACIGVDDPMLMIDYFLENLMPQERAAISFTTGLEPTRERPFRLHFLDRVEPQSERLFESQQVHRLVANQYRTADSGVSR
jgi:hypothetical protein